LQIKRIVQGIALAALASQATVPAVAKNKGGKWTVEVGPIFSQGDAQGKCSKAAANADAKWTGQWWTTQPGRMSVCELTGERPSNLRWPEPPKPLGGGATGPKIEKLSSGKWSVEAGPIHAQIEAEIKCPRAVGAVGGKWTGQWWTTQMGRMSVCEFTR
jgi:mannan-binding protein